jgi:hypothetical protein
MSKRDRFPTLAPQSELSGSGGLSVADLGIGVLVFVLRAFTRSSPNYGQ